MSRRNLDIVIATGGILFAGLIIALALVIRNEGNFARDTVKTQLGEQKIVFATAEKLTDQEKTWKEGSACLTDYAGETMQTGVQAECYANYYIALHLEESAKKAGFEGETYASISTPMAALRTQIADAKAKGDNDGAAALQKQLDGATSLRETQFKGETLRGMLLTSYGFSILGDKAMLAANILFGIAGVAVLLGVAGYIHALATPKEQKVFEGVFTPAGSKA